MKLFRKTCQLPVLTLVLVFAGFACAEPSHYPAENDYFAFLKSLEGDWVLLEGGGPLPLTDKDREEHPEIIWNYKVGSGGHAVIETIMVGTSQEMFSVYHMNAGQVEATHFCAFANQPRLVQVEPTVGGSFAMEGVHITNVPSHDVPHMHAIEHKLLDDGRLWINGPGWADGAIMAAQDLILERR